MLPLAQHHLADADAAALRERIPQEAVGFGRALAGGGEEVWMLEIPAVDVGARDEVADLEGLRGGHPGLGEILVGEDDELTLAVLVALDDVLPGNLDVFLDTEALVVDGAFVPGVELAEVQLAAALHGGVETDGDRHQPEGDRTLPDCTRHTRLCGSNACASERGRPSRGPRSRSRA